MKQLNAYEERRSPADIFAAYVAETVAIFYRRGQPSSMTLDEQLAEVALKYRELLKEVKKPQE